MVAHSDVSHGALFGFRAGRNVEVRVWGRHPQLLFCLSVCPVKKKNLKPAKTADRSVSALLPNISLCWFSPLCCGHTELSVVGSEEPSGCSSLAFLEAGVRQLMWGETSCCRSVVLRPFVWSQPPVVLQSHLHLWPWCVSHQNPQMPQQSRRPRSTSARFHKSVASRLFVK